MVKSSARTKRYLEARGAVVADVEKWVRLGPNAHDYLVKVREALNSTTNTLYHDLEKIVNEYFSEASQFPGGGIRRDLYNCIDILSILGGKLTGIQSCAASRMADHRKKMLAEPKLRHWLSTGNGFELWGWAKKGGRGERKTWQPRIEEVVIHEGGQLGFQAKFVL